MHFYEFKNAKDTEILHPTDSHSAIRRIQSLISRILHPISKSILQYHSVLLAKAEQDDLLRNLC